MSFKQKFQFPSDTFDYGKYRGKSIDYILNNDRAYLDWSLSNGLNISDIVKDHINGIVSYKEKIYYQIDKKNDKFYIRSKKYWVLPKEKFVRKNDKIKVFSDTVLEEHLIDIPFSITIEKRSEWRDYTKFHNDCELVEFEVKIKTYDKNLLDIFINEKMKKYEYAER